MSCNCNITASNNLFACTCDQVDFPATLNIGAGLTDLPRQIGTFAQFRQAMLYSLRAKAPLASWQARKEGDPGVMILEMWAYVCDVLSFYDKVIAQEEYIGTANQRASVRKLLGLLAYLPAPAVAATAQLAALADGRLPVRLPAGTSFRSTAFDGNPPQVFQLMNDTQIDPLANNWIIKAPHIGKVTDTNRGFMLVLPQVTIKPNSLLLLSDINDANQNQVMKVSQAGAYTGNDGVVYTKIKFVSPHTVSTGTPLSQLQLSKPLKTAVIGSLSSTYDDPGYLDILSLDTIYRQIQAGDLIIVEGQSSNTGRESRWFSIYGNTETSISGPTYTVTINGSPFTIPGNLSKVSALQLDTDLNDTTRSSSATYWNDPSTAQLLLHYDLQSVGTITDEAELTLSPGDLFQLAGKFEAPTILPPPSSFLFQDANETSALLIGAIGFSTAQLNPDQGQTLSADMVNPVNVYGNVILVNRGEQVLNEILGSGDATVANQTFKLNKKPLTYLSSLSPGNSQGIQNTLTIYVNGIRWREAASFYAVKKAADQVYIVRQNDDGDSLVTFGDGVHGSRLPSGVSNVQAFYQFGAGRASPSAGAISQISKPVKGLKSIKNPLAAAGGADAETADSMSTNGPRSVLILGRALSIHDYEAVALSVQGVRSAQVEWRWQKTRQQPLVHVWYIGEPGLENNVSQRLHNLSDPTTPIFVENATNVRTTLSLSVQIGSKYLEDNVLTALRLALTNIKTGILAPENLGIGLPLFRSKVFAAALAVEGTLYVDGILLNKEPFIKFAKKPDAGTYFDFEKGSLLLNGKAS